MDISVIAERIPAPGETVKGGKSSQQPGGKGANQAVAAARLGAECRFIGKIGDDAFGDALKESLTQAGVDIENGLFTSTSPTGIALVCIARNSGENSIVVAPGANDDLTPADIASIAHLIAAADTVVCSLEIPLATVLKAGAIAAEHGVRFILNPAPASEMPKELIASVSVLTPNEHEVIELTGGRFSKTNESARQLIADGARAVIVTLGEIGALYFSKDDTHNPMSVPSYKVDQIVDTVGAGDCYTAALAVALSEGNDIPTAMRFAAAAAALSVTKYGAQASMPTREEVERFSSQKTIDNAIPE